MSLGTAALVAIPVALYAWGTSSKLQDELATKDGVKHMDREVQRHNDGALFRSKRSRMMHKIRKIVKPGRMLPDTAHHLSGYKRISRRQRDMTQLF